MWTASLKWNVEKKKTDLGVDHFDKAQIDKNEQWWKTHKATGVPTLSQHNRSQMQLDTNG